MSEVTHLEVHKILKLFKQISPSTIQSFTASLEKLAEDFTAPPGQCRLVGFDMSEGRYWIVGDYDSEIALEVLECITQGGGAIDYRQMLEKEKYKSEKIYTAWNDKGKLLE